LRELELEGIPFPSMPKLLLSADGLVKLTLSDIPDSGYISPHAIATALAVTTTLETLDLRFRSPRSRPDLASRPLPPPTCFVLPALTRLTFTGVYEYLEDLLARIDAPRLNHLSIRFFMDLEFDVPQLHRLINHAEQFKAYGHHDADVAIFNHGIQLDLCPRTGLVDYNSPVLMLGINCKELDWQLSSLAQVCISSFPLISTLEELKIREFEFRSSLWKEDMEDTQWLEFLDPFTSLKNLYLTDEISRHVCGALQELSGERATEVLPSLRNLFVDGSRSLEHLQETIKPFVATRQLSGHPVAIDHWQR